MLNPREIFKALLSSPFFNIQELCFLSVNGDAEIVEAEFYFFKEDQNSIRDIKNIRLEQSIDTCIPIETQLKDS